jgi:hypothetical protein
MVRRHWAISVSLVLAQCSGQHKQAAPAAHEVRVPPPAGNELEMSDLGPVDAGATAPSDACAGKAPPDLVSVVSRRAADAKRCYERALKDDPRLTGRLVVAIRIREDGSVAGVELTEDEIGNATLRDCVQETFSRAIAVHPEGGCIQVVVPLRFVPKQTADAGP